MRVSFQIEPAGLDLLHEEHGIRFYPTQGPNWLMATAFDEADIAVGVLVCEFKTPFDVHFTIVITDPRCVTRRLLRAIFTGLFKRASRVTALIEPYNRRAIDEARRLGFVYEGFMRRGLDGRRDACVYGMLKEDCKFLPRYRGGSIILNTGGAPYHGLHA